MARPPIIFFFFFNDTATTEIYTLSLHDALPICWRRSVVRDRPISCDSLNRPRSSRRRSEEHTSELQSRSDLVCRLLLEKKKTSHIISRHALHSHARLTPRRHTSRHVCSYVMLS